MPVARLLDREVFTGPKQIHYTPPADRGGALLVKAGSIVPTWPEMDYVGQKPVDRITFEVFPGADGEFILYEDDGTTYAFENGEVAETRLSCHPTKAGLVVQVGRRQGSYKGRVDRPELHFLMRGSPRPSGARLNGQRLSMKTTGAWKDPTTPGAVCIECGAGMNGPIRLEITWSTPRRRRSR